MNKNIILLFFVLSNFISGAQTSNWSVVMTSGSYQQSYNDFATTQEVTDYIKKKYTDDKKVLTDIVYAPDRWHVVVSAKTGSMGSQSWLFDSKIPNDWINEKWEKGFEISKITYGNGLWFVYMMDDMNSRVKTQSWATRNSLAEIRAYIDQKYKDDNHYSIEDICFGNGNSSCVTSEKLYFLLKQNFLTQGFTAQSPQYGLLKTDQLQEGGHFTFFKH